MSLFNDASLVLIPSGYKEDVVYSVKPTDGSGDLTFTRASDGTRVNSSGLVENVPWNLLEQSNTFSTTWTLNNVNVTSGQSGYDGANNAWSLSKTAANGEIRQTVLSGLRTFSIYAKAGSLNWLYLLKGGNAGQFFNLSTGQVGTGNAQVISANIQSVGGGWYLCSMVYNDAYNGSLRIYPADADNDTTATSGSIYIQDAQLVEGTTAKPYFPTTDRQNVPRLTYEGGCPSLLLEPQRTNLGINTIWAGGVPPTSWQQANSNGTITAVTSNLGTDATALSFANSGGGSLNVENTIVYTATNYVISFYIESISGTLTYQDLVRLTGSPNITTSAFFLNGASVLASSQVQVGRVEYRFTLGTGATHGARIGSGTGATTITTNTVVLSRPQFEQGAYATSYIPTTSASVTRVADTFTRNNIYTNGLISASGGTWYVELKNNVEYVRDANNGLFLGDSTTINSGNQFAIRNFSAVGVGLLSIVKYISGSGSAIYTATTNNVKIAIKWNGTTADVFANGVKVVSATAFTTTNMENLLGNGSSVPFFIQQMSLFPTPLSDSDCQTLTTI